MAALNVMSWNIESISEKSLVVKIGKQVFLLSNMIAKLVINLDIDLLMIMEVSPLSASTIATDLSIELNSVQSQQPGNNLEWTVFASDPTGKDVPMPDIIPISSFPKACELKFYWPVLSLAYVVSADKLSWELNPGRDKEQDWHVKEALLRCGLSRNDKEVYLVFFRYNSADFANGKYWNNVRGVGVHPRLGGLCSTNSSYEELGYQDSNCLYNGRMPLLIPMFQGSMASPGYFSVLLYHSPFGTSVKPRITANNCLASIAGPSGNNSRVDLLAAPLAVICGDLNVDYDLSNYQRIVLPLPSSDSNSKRTYGFFIATGFQLAIKEQSTLKAKNSVDPSWTDPKAYRSSAYDNICVRASNQNAITQSGIFDLVAYLSNSQNWSNLGLNFVGHNVVYDAFLFYRTYVSDHLPAVAKLTF